MNYHVIERASKAMDELETIIVTLHAKVAAQVRQAVTAGEYDSASGVIEEALLHWEHERDSFDMVSDLKAAWQESVNDSRDGLDPEPVFARLRKQFQTTSDNPSQQ